MAHTPGDYLTLLHTKYKSSRPHGFREEDFLCFPIVSQWELSVAMETTVLIQSALKPNAVNPPTEPNDGSHKICSPSSECVVMGTLLSFKKAKCGKRRGQIMLLPKT